jgi:hypothetical protein
MMPIAINQSDVANVKRMMEGIKGGARKVMKRAVDKTMGTVKTTVSRVARETLNVYKRDLDKNIGITKYNYAKASGTVTIIGASIPVYDFKPVQLLTGVQIKIKKKGPSKLIEGAFIATMKAGNKGATHTGVFWREWHEFKNPNSIILKKRWKKMPKKYRLKIHELFTTSVPEAVGDKLPMDTILADAEVNLHKNIEHELSYELSKL